MSLNFDFTRCADRGACVDGDGHVTGALETIVWATMFVGMGEITTRNAGKFALRLRAYETAVAPISTGSRVNEDVVRRYVGLRTNVSSKTDVQFAAWIGRIVMDRAKKELENEAIQVQGRDID